MGSHALHPLITGTKTRITALHQHGELNELRPVRAPELTTLRRPTVRGLRRWVSARLLPSGARRRVS